MRQRPLGLRAATGISFTWDVFGRRLSKAVNGTPGSGLKLWDGWLSADAATGRVVETLRAMADHPFFVKGRGRVELWQVEDRIGTVFGM